MPTNMIFVLNLHKQIQSNSCFHTHSIFISTFQYGISNNNNNSSFTNHSMHDKLRKLFDKNSNENPIYQIHSTTLFSVQLCSALRSSALGAATWIIFNAILSTIHRLQWWHACGDAYKFESSYLHVNDISVTVTSIREGCGRTPYIYNGRMSIIIINIIDCTNWESVYRVFQILARIESTACSPVSCRHGIEHGDYFNIWVWVLTRVNRG